jgi:Arm DNA-binding domain
MPKRVLTETFLQSLLRKPPPAVRVTYTEPGRTGFQMRHEPGGALSFWVRITGKGGEKPMRLGNYPAMSLAETHEAHAAARSLQARGLDPRVERAAAARAREAQERHERSANAVTVRNVIAE